MPATRRQQGSGQHAAGTQRSHEPAPVPAETPEAPLSVPPVPPVVSNAVKKSTSVDVITSKIAFEAVIPVDIRPDAASFTSKCKLYDIIDGKNPLSDDDEPEADGAKEKAVSTMAKPEQKEESPHRTTPEHTPSGGGRRRKRSVSPALGSGGRRRGGIKKEEDEMAQTVDVVVDASPAVADAEHFVSYVSPSPLLADVQLMPTIANWSQARLSDSTPFQLQTSKDAETRIKYMLDDSDYEWCAAQNVSVEVLQKSFTFYEWTYASFLLNAVMPAESAASPPASAGSNNSSADGGGPATSRSARSKASQLTPNIRNFITQAKKLHSTVCAVCAKPLHVLTAADRARLAELQATESIGLKCSECDTLAHLQCWFLPITPRHPERWVCDGCYLCRQHRRRASFTRCVVCGRGGGVLLLYKARGTHPGVAGSPISANGVASAFPSAPSAAARGSEGLTWRNADEEAPPVGVPSPGSPSSSAHTSESGVCHAVCALAFPELTIQLCNMSAMAGNGNRHVGDCIDSSRSAHATLDMGLRPCVVPTRRIPKRVCHCIYCQHAAYPTVQCQHPRCYESMHPSCAAEQHTLDCFSVEDGTRHSGGSTRSACSGGGGAEEMDSASEKIVTVEQTGTQAPRRGREAPPADKHASPTAAQMTPWTGCSVFCRKHFGYNINRALGSAAMAEKAEAQALKMDLHSLLSGLPMEYTPFFGETQGGSRTGKAVTVAEDGRGVESGDNAGARGRRSGTAAPTPITTFNESFFLHGSLPVVKAVRRGPGRPSAAELRRREVERTVVAAVRQYWLRKRAEKRKQSAAIANDINILCTKPILAAALRPELIKISPTKVRLSHFFCLIPEWQQVLVALVEGELPLADEEYDDVQRYRKAAAHTRRSGNTAGLFQRMLSAHQNLGTFRDCCDALKLQGALRQKQVETELQWCDALTGWGSCPTSPSAKR